MPAWGDRLSEAQIQAIVGFIRSWEATAPEIAQPVRVRGPWWQGNTTPGGGQQLPSGGAAAPAETQANTPASAEGPITTHQGNGPGSGGDSGTDTHAGSGSPWVTPELPWYQTLDPRSTILILGVIFTAAFMILVALSGLRKLTKLLR